MRGQRLKARVAAYATQVIDVGIFQDFQEVAGGVLAADLNAGRAIEGVSQWDTALLLVHSPRKQIASNQLTINDKFSDVFIPTLADE